MHSQTGDPFLKMPGLQPSQISIKYQRELNIIINYVLHQQFSMYTISHM